MSCLTINFVYKNVLHKLKMKYFWKAPTDLSNTFSPCKYAFPTYNLPDLLYFHYSELSLWIIIPMVSLSFYKVLDMISIAQFCKSAILQNCITYYHSLQQLHSNDTSITKNDETNTGEKLSSMSRNYRAVSGTYWKPFTFCHKWNQNNVTCIRWL